MDKLLSIFGPPKDKMSYKVEAEQKRELKVVGQLRPQKGHIAFEFNERTGEIRPAEYKSSVVDFSTNQVKREIVKREGCVYVTALNAKNALKKLSKR